MSMLLKFSYYPSRLSMICSQNDVQCEKVDSRVVPSVTHVDEIAFPEEHIRFERSAGGTSSQERDCEHEVCWVECNLRRISDRQTSRM